jgi:hypothetical protein
MFNNYTLKNLFPQFSSSSESSKDSKSISIGFKLGVVLMFLFALTSTQAQTTIIDPAGDGGFNNGSTFAANGWTVANQGSGDTKWALGTAVSASNSGTTQATTATGMAATSFTATLAATNTNIAIGQLVTGTNIATGTYVSNISGTTLTLSKATTNVATITSAVTLTFTAISANISGNSAYVSANNGLSNSYNYSAARRIYFYRDVTLPAGETAYSLTFDVRSLGSQWNDAWQVFVAPTSVTPVGLDSQSSSVLPTGATTGAVPSELAGAVSLTYGAGILYPQSMFASIPPSFAGQTVRLIFMWTNDASGGSSNPAAIDNIKLTSRVAGDVTTVSSGLFSNPGTWDAGVPTAADNMVIDANHSVNIDKRQITVAGLYVAGSNAFLDYGFNSDELLVTGDMQVSGSGARFNNFYTTTGGKSLKIAGNIDIVTGGRFDSSVASTTAGIGALAFIGSAPQTFTVDSSSFLGSNATALTTSSNLNGILGQVIFNNTSTTTPNIIWAVSSTTDPRIKSTLTFTKGRVAVTGSSKFIIGNYNAMSDSATGYSAGLGQGIVSGTVGRYFTATATSVSNLLNTATDYTVQPYPFVSANGAKRHAFIVRPTVAGAVAGEVYVTYTDSNSVSSASVADGAYSINTVYDGSWAITKDAFYANTAGTDIALYASGAYSALDGTSRILKSGNVAASGAHATGTSNPYAIRTSVTASDLFSGSFKIGAASASAQATFTKTSVASGSWTAATTWSPAGVPSCSDVVAIASGHTVTLAAGATAAGVTIASGGTLSSLAASDLTVGCTNNKAAFVNNGTYSIAGGTLKVNGSVIHNTGSTFNQTGGDIFVDSNNAGDAATSVGVGGSSFKIDNPASLNLAAGKITIVDPLVNQEVATTATSANDFTATVAPTWTFSTSGAVASGTFVLTFNPFNDPNVINGAVGSYVTGTGIPAGTTIVSTAPAGVTNVSITLSNALTASVASGTAITFSAMNNGNANIFFPSTNITNLSVGQVITGTGIPSGTTVINKSAGLTYGYITLSNAVTGLGTSPITASQTLTGSAASVGCNTIILNAANSAIAVGMAVTGTGIQSGTVVTSISGTRLDISKTATGSISVPATVSFYKSNPASYSFVYNSLTHNVAGMNHTLQFGNGVSTDNTSVITNGFLTSCSVGGGVLSLGNLTIDATNADRFVSSINKLNVQNTFTVNSGSVFLKAKQLGLPNGANDYGAAYFGGNIINNGTILTRYQSQTFGFDNLLNGVEVPTTIAQTISGSGNFYDTYELTSTTSGTGALSGMTVNNKSAGGLTIAVPNFRIEGQIVMNNGIIHTSSAYPLYHGVVGSTTPQLAFANPYSNTCHIDGPYERVVSTTNTNTTYPLFPVGKAGTYMPISFAIAGGGIYRVEAYTTNSGTPSSNIASLSNKRWVVQRVGTTGTPSTYNVRVGASDITASNIPVQASTDEGTYDNTLGATSTYAAAGAVGATVDLVNNVTSTVAGTWSGSAAYFSYATGPACSGTPAPGNTLASLSSVCGGQTSTLSLQNVITPSLGITYQWQASTDGGTTYSNISGATATTYVANPTSSTYYRCNVTCGANTGTSTAVQVTISSSATITGSTPASQCDGTPTALTLGATASSGTINWYGSDAASDIAVLGTGTSFVTPVMTGAKTYYAGVDTTTANSFTKTFSGSSTTTDIYSGLVFNASSKLVLNSVKVYPKQTSTGDNLPITVALYNAAGAIVGSPVTFTPNANITTTLTAQTVTLNYTIPAGNGYKLLAIGGLTTLNGLGRNTQTLPFTQGAITVSGGLSNLGAVAGTTYYNFYDWSWSELCSSPRVAVKAEVGTIATQPTNPTICKALGATTSISVTAALSTPTYQWFVQAPAATTWTALLNTPNYSGVTSATLAITRTSTTVPAVGTKYRVEVGGGSCTATPSNMVTLQEVAVLSKATAITVVTKLTPALTTCQGSSVVLSLAAGSIGNIQWQSSIDNSTWTNIGTPYTQTALSVANPAMTFTSDVLSQSTWFRVIASNGVCSTATSLAVKITVSTPPTTGTISGGNVTVCAPAASALDLSGTAVLFTNSTTLTLNGTSLGATILWQKSTNYNSSTPIWAAAGSIASSLVVTDLKATTWYRTQVTNGACVSYSEVVKITVNLAAKAGVVTSPVSVCYGGDITFTSAAYTGNSIQWEVSTTSATTGFSAVSGETRLVFAMKNVLYAPLSKFYVRSVVTSGSCTISRSAVKTILVDPLSVAGTVTGGGTVCSAGGGTLKLAGNTGKLQWQYSTDGTNYSNVPVSPATAATFATSSVSGTAATYVVTNVSGDTYFRALVTSGACSSSISNVVQYVVGTSATAGTATATNSTVCSGTGTTITLAGSLGSIVWQKSTTWLATTPVWSNVTTSVTSTVSTGNLTTSTAYRAMVTIGSCSTVYSNEAVVTVPAAPLAKTITANVTTPAGTLAAPLCTSSSLKVLTVTPGYIGTIQWQTSTTSTTTGFADISGEIATTYTVSGAANGANYYRVKFTNSCGVSAYSAALTVYYVTCLTSNNDSPVVYAKAPFGVVVYPNPFAETINLNLTTTSEAKVAVVVYDMTGKLVEQREVSPSEVSELQIGDRFPSGVYNIVVTQGEEVKTLRVVKR